MVLSANARVVYIGDGRMFAKGLSVSLSDARHEFLATCFDPEAVEHTVERHQPDIAVIGPLRPRWLAFDLCRKAVICRSETRVIIVTRDAEDDLVAADALYAGANACVDTRIDPDDMVRLIERVLLGARLFTLDQMQAAFNVDGLTDRQAEVLRHRAQGLRSREIARAMGVTIHTVRNQLADIRSKLEVRMTKDAVERGLRRGLI
jgi:DNA-binding NarL/FixJ family response regulator